MFKTFCLPVKSVGVPLKTLMKPLILFLVSLIQCAESGVKYLESMLCVRSPVVLDGQESVETKDADMVHLLRQGFC